MCAMAKLIYGGLKMDLQSVSVNGYKCFYKDKTAEVKAETSYSAQQKAAEIFKAKRAYEVTVVLCEKNGEQVTHKPTF